MSVIVWQEIVHALAEIKVTVEQPPQRILDSIVVSIPACHAGDRGSIPRRGGCLFL